MVIDEETAQLFRDMGVTEDKIAALQKQMDSAEAVRGQAGPEGRAYGGVYTAANPLEHIGDFMQKYQAMKQLKGGETQMGELNQQRRGIQGSLWGQLYGGGHPASAALRGGINPGMQQLDDLAMGRMGRGA